VAPNGINHQTGGFNTLGSMPASANASYGHQLSAVGNLFPIKAELGNPIPMMHFICNTSHH
jgi:hypothetical protein